MPTDTRPPARRPADDERSGRRALLLRLLRGAGEPRTIADLAEEMGVHANTVRFHLDTLIADRRVERVLGRSEGPGRPPVGYRLTVGMDRHGPTNYRLLAVMFTHYLAASEGDPAQTATELGRTWGSTLLDESTAPAAAASPTAGPTAGASRARKGQRVTRSAAMARMVDVLADLGFEPEQPSSPKATEIGLRHCPFLDLVDERADVVCALHFGLMQGMLAATNGPVTVDRLVPFEEPDRCVAHLAAVGTTGRQLLGTGPGAR